MTGVESPSLRQVAPAVYGPSLLFAVGQGAVYPIVALSARELGASVGTASLVVAVLGIGQVLGNLPAGWLAHRAGERRAMVLSTVVTVPALGLCVVAPNVWVLSLAVLMTGLASSVWGLARHSYLTDVAPAHLRARALSTLGGVHRIGMFIGPFLGALATAPLGTDGAYGLYLVMALLAVGLLLSLPEPPGAARGAGESSSAVSLPSMVRSHARVLATLGVACLLVQAVRQARLSVLPLWAEAIGLSVAETSLVFGIAGAVDMLLFYPAGSAMDRFGRVWVAVPSLLVLAIGHALLPLTSSFWMLTLVALVMGVGNGMGSGLVMTLGSDASPVVGRPVFLGAWRLVANLGAAGGPLVVSLVTAVAPLAAASLAVAGLGVLGAAALGRWTPPHQSPSSHPR